MVETEALARIDTPALLLDPARMAANIKGMNQRLTNAGVVLRPHVKTCKSLPVLAQMLAAHSDHRVTVSTVEEARRCLQAGYRDILYAVGLAPGRIAPVARLLEQGAADRLRMGVIVDNQPAVDALKAAAPAFATELAVYIELDVDGERAGVDPDSSTLLELGQRLQGIENLRFAGVMTHAGGVYHCFTPEARRAMADRERGLAVHAAQRLRAAGIACDAVSIGSTPTLYEDGGFDGISEVRAGVYVFQDLTMAGLGVCGVADIALSVLTTVIGSQPQRQTLVVDAGWMALSSDRSTAGHVADQGLGLVCDQQGQPLPERLVVAAANQEHGLIRHADGATFDTAAYPVGTRLRVLPVHACATASQFDRYHLLPDAAQQWPRFNGWG